MFNNAYMGNGMTANAMYQPTYPNIYQRNIPSQNIVKVNGRNGAEAYQIPANSSVLLLDESNPILWLKVTDGAGYPTITPYNITPYEEAKVSNVADLESRISRLENIIKEKNVDEPDIERIKQSKNK